MEMLIKDEQANFEMFPLTYEKGEEVSDFENLQEWWIYQKFLGRAEFESNSFNQIKVGLILDKVLKDQNLQD